MNNIYEEYTRILSRSAHNIPLGYMAIGAVFILSQVWFTVISGVIIYLLGAHLLMMQERLRQMLLEYISSYGMDAFRDFCRRQDRAQFLKKVSEANHESLNRPGRAVRV
jgi:cytochrome c biogenesis protein CcdA